MSFQGPKSPPRTDFMRVSTTSQAARRTTRPIATLPKILRASDCLSRASLVRYRNPAYAKSKAARKMKIKIPVLMTFCASVAKSQTVQSTPLHGTICFGNPAPVWPKTKSGKARASE